MQLKTNLRAFPMQPKLSPSLVSEIVSKNPNLNRISNFRIVFSFDLRSSSGGGQHWKDEGVLAKRGYVYYEESPHSCRSSLNLDPVVGGDGGQYRCRVDYETSPTRNTRIKLKLVGEFSSRPPWPQSD